MSLVHFISPPKVIIDPDIPVPQWSFSEVGIKRMNQFVAKLWIRSITSVFCSAEQKAIDGTTIIAGQLSLSFTQIEDIGEHDQSATGILKKEAFQAMATRFFNNPERSIARMGTSHRRSNKNRKRH